MKENKNDAKCEISK